MLCVRWREDAENNKKLLEISHFGGKTRCGGEILNFSLNVFLGLNFGLKDLGWKMKINLSALFFDPKNNFLPIFTMEIRCGGDILLRRGHHTYAGIKQVSAWVSIILFHQIEPLNEMILLG